LYYLFVQGKSAAPVTKEELGRATWTFLHTLAAQVLPECSFTPLNALHIYLLKFNHSIDDTIRGFIFKPFLFQYPEHPTRQQKKDVKELVTLYTSFLQYFSQ
jgi:FAD-linked sulfhydryl oxidase